MRRYVPVQHNYKRFYLRYKAEPFLIEEPNNWMTAKRELTRNLQYHGIFVTLSDGINFSGYGRKKILEWYSQDGVIANIEILQYEKNQLTDEWELVFVGKLDISTIEYEDEIVNVKINSTELQQKLQSRYETEISIDNLESLDGKTFDREPERITVELLDRVLVGENTLDIGGAYESRNLNEARDRSTVLFTNNTAGYYAELPQVYTPAREIVTTDGVTTDHFFFWNKQKQNVEVSFRINFKANFELPAGSNSGQFNLELVSYLYDEEVDDGTNLQANQNIQVSAPFSVIPGQSQTYVYDGTKKMVVAPNEGVVLWMTHNFPGNPDWTFEIESATLNPYANTTFSPTTCQAFLPFTFFERFLQLIGANSLESTYLSESRLSILNGFMIRNAPQKPISFTFEKLFQSFDSVEPMGMMITGNSARIEKREFFYQNFLAYDFGDAITDVKYEFDRERAYSEIKVGFETSNFTKEDALNEYAVRTVWTTPINTYQMELNMVSSIQASSNVIEALRRVQYNENVERSFTRRGDSTVFFIDLKDEENKPRIWADDYVEPPIVKDRDGVVRVIDNAASAYNLRLTPAQTLYRHGQWISFGMDKFLDKEYRFSSSTGGTEMITQKADEPPIKEDANFEISDCGLPRFTAERVTFTIEPSNLYNLLTTPIGNVIYAYGIFRFTHNGIQRSGYLMSYKPETLEVTLQLIA